jgi:hypothetical protein
MKKMLVIICLMLGCFSTDSEDSSLSAVSNNRDYLSQNMKYFKDMTANVCYYDVGYMDSTAQPRFRYLPCTPEIDAVAIKFQSMKNH